MEDNVTSISVEDIQDLIDTLKSRQASKVVIDDLFDAGYRQAMTAAINEIEWLLSVRGVKISGKELPF